MSCLSNENRCEWDSLSIYPTSPRQLPVGLYDVSSPGFIPPVTHLMLYPLFNPNLGFITPVVHQVVSLGCPTELYPDTKNRVLRSGFSTRLL